MFTRPNQPQKQPESRGWFRRGWVGVVLAVAIGAAYLPHSSAPFFFDDEPAIVGNPTIRQLWPIWGALQPPADGAGVTGRPLVNLSLAINYAMGRLDVRGYRIANVALHLGAALLLWGVMRRTLRLPTVPAKWAKQGEAIAFCTALGWAVHPLLSESVLFVVQRNEIMAAVFYLWIFYSTLRSTEPEARGRAWQIVAVAGCWLGVASKEVIATAPLLLLLFDRTFLAGSFRAAWKERRGLYVGLFSSWLLLALLVFGAERRADTVGFGLGLSSWHYLLTQGRAVVIYLKLAIWPSPLVADYGTPVVRGVGAVWMQGLLLTGLLGVSVWGAFRLRTLWGFLGVSFFVVLAPSSSFLPLTTQTMAEHRMYLPLSALVALSVGGLVALGGRRALVIATGLAVPCWAGLTWVRGQDYMTAKSIWVDTVAKAPANPRAHLNLGKVFIVEGNWSAAEQEYAEAARLRPEYAEAHHGLGLVAEQSGHSATAIEEFETALRLSPPYFTVRNDLARVLARTGQSEAALRQLDEVLQAHPDFFGARINRGNVLRQLARWPAAEADYATVLAARPESFEARLGLGQVSLATGRVAEAIDQLAAAARLAPENPIAKFALGNVLLTARRPLEAVEILREAVGAEPKSAEVRASLGIALMQSGRRREALEQYQAAVAIAPDNAELRLSYALTLAASGRLAEAVTQGEEALRLRPGFEAASRYVAQFREDLEKARP